MNIPEDLFYTKDHEWVRIEGQTATIGITEFAQGELGDIVYVDITSEGEEVAANEVFGSVEAVKTVSDLFMPLTGTVSEVNALLESEPEKINQDPFGEGWIVKVTLNEGTATEDLLSAAAYEELIG